KPVYGEVYNTRDASSIREDIHAGEVAKANGETIRRLAEHPQKQKDVFNTGTGQERSELAGIRDFANSTGVQLDYPIGPRRPGDVEQVWGDVTKSTKELNWKAKLGLDEMMRSAWAWEEYIKENPF